MDTPICEFLQNYCATDAARFHMPGHKGRLTLPTAWDITEVAGADALFEADGILLRSEENAAALYGASATLYSAGGSTLSIQTMLSLACRPGDVVVAARNAHAAFYHSCELLDLRPVYVLPDYADAHGVGGSLPPSRIADALTSHPEAKAVYLTSPDYMGHLADIERTAAVCQEAHLPLLVDNAHGAHLRFLPQDQHPITLGAAACCDSAHKTLPVLTGGGYLHLSPRYCRDEAKAAMARFGSTSPSYLILASLDQCNAYLAGEAKSDFAQLAKVHQRLSAVAQKAGWQPDLRTDPTKLTLDPSGLGYTGMEAAAYLRRQGIELEYAGPDRLVLLMTPCNREEDFDRLAAALASIPPREPIASVPFQPPAPVCRLSPREAAFAPAETVAVDDAGGRICAETKITCPPGVPLVAAGEEITTALQKVLKNCSIQTLKVVK